MQSRLADRMGHQLDVNQLVDFRYDNALSNDNLWSSNNIMLVNKTSLRSNLSCDYQRCLNAKGFRISRTKDMWTITLVKLRVEMREHWKLETIWEHFWK